MTIEGYNFGNRLQNYALQEFLKKNDLEVDTLINACSKYDTKIKMGNQVFMILYKLYIKSKIVKSISRCNKFLKFNKKHIRYSKYTVNNNKRSWGQKLIDNYDYFICGSDQIWNPSFLSNGAAHFLYYVPKEKKLTYAPSFGVDEVQDSRKGEYKKYLEDFCDISVREEKGREIVEDLLGYNDAKVLVDPTMLLTAEEWDRIAIRPKEFDRLDGRKYILNYFLGTLSDTRKKEILRIASENNCLIIDLLDKNDPFYSSGPSEFLYLEKNAFLICTDSFHSSVFAFLYNRPFVVFNREGKMSNMNSRIQTLISKFGLEDRAYIGDRITQKNLSHDYSKAFDILEMERKKAKEYLVNLLHK